MGMWHWLNNTVVRESVVVLLDPDQILVHPLQNHMKSSQNAFVQEGRPTHNKYGYGCNWRKHCQLEHCKKTTCRDAYKHVVGPPYMMHINDWKRHAPLWHYYTHFTRPEDCNNLQKTWIVYLHETQNMESCLKCTVVTYVLIQMISKKYLLQIPTISLTIPSPHFEKIDFVALITWIYLLFPQKMNLLTIIPVSFASTNCTLFLQLRSSRTHAPIFVSM